MGCVSIRLNLCVSLSQLWTRAERRTSNCCFWSVTAPPRCIKSTPSLLRVCASYMLTTSAIIQFNLPSLLPVSVTFPPPFSRPTMTQSKSKKKKGLGQSFFSLSDYTVQDTDTYVMLYVYIPSKSNEHSLSPEYRLLVLIISAPLVLYNTHVGKPLITSFSSGSWKQKHPIILSAILVAILHHVNVLYPRFKLQVASCNFPTDIFHVHILSIPTSWNPCCRSFERRRQSL